MLPECSSSWSGFSIDASPDAGGRAKGTRVADKPHCGAGPEVSDNGNRSGWGERREHSGPLQGRREASVDDGVAEGVAWFGPCADMPA